MNRRTEIPARQKRAEISHIIDFKFQAVLKSCLLGKKFELKNSKCHYVQEKALKIT